MLHSNYIVITDTTTRIERSEAALDNVDYNGSGISVIGPCEGFGEEEVPGIS